MNEWFRLLSEKVGEALEAWHEPPFCMRENLFCMCKKPFCMRENLFCVCKKPFCMHENLFCMCKKPFCMRENLFCMCKNSFCMRRNLFCLSKILFCMGRNLEIHGREIRDKRRRKGETKFGPIQRKEKDTASRTSFNALRRGFGGESRRLKNGVTC
jgi:hypothetical protein